MLPLNQFMKQLYFINLMLVICLFTVTSCSPKFRFVTTGLKDVDSSYVIENDGHRTDAAKIIVRANSVKVDGQKVVPSNLSVIKSKKKYFSVSKGSIYPAEIYGKINLLYQMSYNSLHGSYHSGYNPGGTVGSTTTAVKGYFLQKQGSSEIVRFTRSAFLDYLADNPKAENLAKAHFIWQNTSWISFAGYAAGIIYVSSAVGNSKPLGVPIALLGGSAITHFVLTSIADYKLKKAVKVYNGISQ